MAPTTTAATPTRSVLGPLTATWTAPSTCTSLGFLTPGDLRRAQSCWHNEPFEDLDCWPPRAAWKPTPILSLSGWGVYSPGFQCPAGQTTACVGSPQNLKAYPSIGGSSGDWAFQFPLKQGEKGAGCCPTGFSCARNGGSAQMCQHHVQTTDTATLTAQRCGASPTTIAYPDTGGQAINLYAPLFQLVWRDEDLHAMNDSGTHSKDHDRHSSKFGDNTRSRASQGAEGLRSPDPSPTATAARAQSSPDTGPDTGTIAAGVLGGLVGLIVVLVAFLFLLRWTRRRREANERPADGDPHNTATKSEPECSSIGYVEVDAGFVGCELDGSRHDAKELDAAQCAVMELDGDRPFEPERRGLYSRNMSQFHSTSHGVRDSGYSVFPAHPSSRKGSTVSGAFVDRNSRKCSTRKDSLFDHDSRGDPTSSRPD